MRTTPFKEFALQERHCSLWFRAAGLFDPGTQTLNAGPTPAPGLCLQPETQAVKIIIFPEGQVSQFRPSLGDIPPSVLGTFLGKRPKQTNRS